MTSSVTGFWTGHYFYATSGAPKVEFQAELEQIGDVLHGNITEQNTFDPFAGQMLVAELIGRVSGGAVSFTKSYMNAGNRLQKIQYRGALSSDENEIAGSWAIGMATGPFKMRRAIEQKPKAKVVRKEKLDVGTL